jgi:hypothetical protein
MSLSIHDVVTWLEEKACLVSVTTGKPASFLGVIEFDFPTSSLRVSTRLLEINVAIKVQAKATYGVHHACALPFILHNYPNVRRSDDLQTRKLPYFD